MAQELLRYQPTADGREGWHARIAELITIANVDPALGGAQGVRELDPAAGHLAPCRRGETTYAMGWLKWGPN
jgi:hypothetical protein